jgi:hypothetical protein
MKDIVIAGDSFCAQSHTWPKFLADKLGLNLVCYGRGGEHWWGVKKFLDTVDKSNVEVIVIVHTFGQRIPTEQVIASTKEREQAIELYYKHIHNEEFLTWAELAWHKQIEQDWGEYKLINLHSFPWTIDKPLAGINVTPSLGSISLNEVDAQDGIIDERILAPGKHRTNHLNLDNNYALADELTRIIQNNSNQELDLTKFQQQTTRWLTWR